MIKNFVYASICISLIVICCFVTYARMGLQVNDMVNADDQTGSTNLLNDTEDISIQSDEPSVVDDIYNERIFDSWLTLPLLEMDYADEEAFEFLKESYAKVNYYGEFIKGEEDLYQYYIDKYRQLLNNEVRFIDTKTGEEFYINQYEYADTRYDPDACDWNKYDFYFFDMNEDGTPELCINRHGGFTYIFKYIPSSNTYILWYEMGTMWYSIIGSKKANWVSFGTGSRYAFYQLDQNGGAECITFFLEEENYNRKTEQADVAYVMTLPRYKNKDKQIQVKKEIEKQTYFYFDGDEKVYCFRVTEKQYKELTESYFKAKELAEENLKEVTFTYDELFGELDY